MKRVLPGLLACLFVFSAVSTAPAAPAARLMLWARSEDLAALPDGTRLDRWPDATGQHRDLTAEGDWRPTVVRQGPGGKPAVHFDGNGNATPKVLRHLMVPLEGEWRGATIVLVGTNLNTLIFGTAPGGQGELRVLGWAQHTTAKADLPNLFDQVTPGVHLGLITDGITPDGKITVTTWLDGVQRRQAAGESLYGISFHQPSLGGYLDWTSWTGDLSEVLIYQGILDTLDRTRLQQFLLAKYGLVPTTTNGPMTPPGFPVAPVILPPPPPPVRLQPARAGLKLWARADDIHGAKDGDAVISVPNQANPQAPLTSEAGHEPHLVARLMNQRPALRFEADDQKNVKQWLKLPLEGEWPQLTVVVAGRNLRAAGLLDTNPGSNQTLRHLGLIQHTGGRLGLTAFRDDGMLTDGVIWTFTARQQPDHTTTLSSWINGVLQNTQTAGPADIQHPFSWHDPRLGVINLHEVGFRGEVAEVLIYDHELTEAERRQTDEYLAEKYRLLLPTPAQLAAARSPFSLRMAHLPAQQTWVHNTFPGGYTTGWVQTGVFDMLVQPDGTLLLGSVWDESHKEVGYYRDGKALRQGFSGGTSALASDGQYLYIGVSGMSKPRSGIRRLKLLAPDQMAQASPLPDPILEAGSPPWNKAPLQFAPFATGEGPEGIVWQATEKPWQEIVCMLPHGNELWVTRQGVNRIQVLNRETGAALRTIELPAEPGRMVATPQGEVGAIAGTPPQGEVWVIVGTEVWELKADGTPTGLKIKAEKPTSLAFNAFGQLLVGDDGPRQQVLEYDPKIHLATNIFHKPVVTVALQDWALGVKGGVFAPPRPGQMGPDRLWGVKSIGLDAAGNLYVLGNLSLVRSYTPKGELRWQMEATSFCTVGGMDPASDCRELYTGDTHYTLGTSPTPTLATSPMPGSSPWRWTGVLTDPNRWKGLATAGDGYLLRHNGQLLRYGLGLDLRIHVQEPNSEIFKPAGLYCYDGRASQGYREAPAPKDGVYTWNDLNGDGAMQAEEITTLPAGSPPMQWSVDVQVDPDFGLWQPQGRWGIRYLPLKGWTAAGAPIYDLAQSKVLPRPAEFIEVGAVWYEPAGDTLYVGGVTWDHPLNGNESWGWVGREIIRYDDWNKPTRHIVSRMVVPPEAWTPRAWTILHQRNLVFVAEMGTAVTFVYDSTTGKLVGILEPDKSQFGPSGGWYDRTAAIRAYQRRNGEIVMVAEDSLSNKSIIYTIPAGFKPLPPPSPGAIAANPER